jgi:hypothetical protein
MAGNRCDVSEVMGSGGRGANARMEGGKLVGLGCRVPMKRRNGQVGWTPTIVCLFS